MLGQTEMFTPAATRKLFVAPGHVNFWGIDPSTKRVAIATISADGVRDSELLSFPTLESGARLDSIYQGVRALAHELALRCPPGVVLVEQTSGKFENPNLAYAVGVTVAAAWRGVHDATGAATVVETVTSSAWKKEACGHGGIRKPKLTGGEEYAVLRWAQTIGYRGSSWDVADAWGIAEAARRRYALEQV